VKGEVGARALCDLRREGGGGKPLIGVACALVYLLGLNLKISPQEGKNLHQRRRGPSPGKTLELELVLIQTHVAQKLMLRVKVGALQATAIRNQ